MSSIWGAIIGSSYTANAQISSTIVNIVAAPLIDSVSYDCNNAVPIQVHATDVLACTYSIESTVPAFSEFLITNTTGTFEDITGITHAVFRVNNGVCYTDIAISFDCNGDPLPIVLLDFQAALHEQTQGKITWSIEQDENLAYFELEFATDGTNFTHLAHIDRKAANGTIDYLYIDPVLESGYNFYRLKIFNQDGSYFYSPIRSLIYQIPNQLIWYPNPASDFVYIEFENGQKNTTFQYQIIGADGRIMTPLQQYSLTRGNNKIAVNVHDMADGTYFIHYRIGDTSPSKGTIKFEKISK